MEIHIILQFSHPDDDFICVLNDVYEDKGDAIAKAEELNKDGQGYYYMVGGPKTLIKKS